MRFIPAFLTAAGLFLAASASDASLEAQGENLEARAIAPGVRVYASEGPLGANMSNFSTVHHT